ncbi:MAG: hypothetical protein HYY14_05575 [Candidatus Omnitrophica bacterium]|nr:hypothetical protein [Candidatus Omnitrophota bacterium]
MLKSFFRDAGIVMLGTSLANVCNLLYQIYMVRNLDGEAFGVLTTLLASLIIFSIPCFALQTVIAKWSAEFKAKAESEKIRLFFWDVGKWVCLFLVFFLAVAVWQAETVAGFLQIDVPGLILVTAGSVVFATLLPLWLGILQGLERFAVMGLVLIAAALLKVVLGVLFVELGWAVTGALLAVLFSLSFIIPVPWWACRQWTLPPVWSGWRWSLAESGEACRYMLPAGFTFLCFAVLTGSDMVLVKHFFSPFTAGVYAKGSMVGKIVLFLPLAVGWTLLPKAAGRRVLNQGSSGLLKLSLLLGAVMCGLAVLVSFAYPAVYVWLFRVDHQELFVPLTRFFSVAMSFYALTQIIMIYQLSVRNLSFLGPMLLLSCIQLGLIVMFHQSLEQVLWILCLCGVSALALNVVRVEWGSLSKLSA